MTYNAQASGAEVEFNNSSGQANTLTSGVAVSGHHYDDTDEDYFKINVGSSGTLTVQATSTNYASLQVLNPSLQVVGSVDYLSSGTKTVSVGVGASGYYYVRLFDSGSSFFDTDPYELTVTYEGETPAKPTLTLVSKTSTSVSLSMSSNGDGSSPITQWDTSCEIPALSRTSSDSQRSGQPVSLGMPSTARRQSLPQGGPFGSASKPAGLFYQSNPQLRQVTTNDVLAFETPDGEVHYVPVSKAAVTPRGNLQVQGESGDTSIFAVVAATGDFFGSISVNGVSYQATITDGQTLVYSSADGGISNNPFLNDMDIDRLLSQKSVSEETPPISSLDQNTTTITVGVLYDNTIRDNVNYSAMVDFYVGVANQSYQNSGLNIQFDVVAIANYEPYISYTDMWATLSSITCNSTNCNPLSGVNPTVDAWRDTVMADMVAQFVFWGTTGGTCGIAQLPYDATNITVRNNLRQYTYSVNALYLPLEAYGYPACDDIVMAHEMGHNFGLWHDRDTLVDQGWTGIPEPLYSYAHGYKRDGIFGTVMSYSSDYIRYLSNPNISSNGYPIGIPIGQVNEAFAAQAVANVMAYHEAIYDNAPAVYHTVTAVGGLGGTISPTSASVREGATTSFTLTPDSGYAIGSVSGCGGSLSGNIYTTGAIYSPCSISVSFQRYQWTESTSGSAVTFSGLPSGYTYGCSTVATNLAGSSPASDTLSFSLVPPSTPSVPVNVRADSGDGEIYLYFTAGDDGGSPVTQFTATCTDGINSFVASSGSSPIIVTGLTNDTPYTCRVTATNGVGTSPATAPTPPIVPEETVVGLPIWLLYQATQ